MNPRKLAAMDIVLHGSKLIVTEFAGAAVLCGVLGGFVVVRAHSLGELALGAYLVSLALNYVPLLIYAVVITSGGGAQRELGDELVDCPRAAHRYGRQSLALLVPLFVPVAALAWELRKPQRLRAGP